MSCKWTQNTVSLTIFFVFFTFLASCKPGVPNKYIQPGKIENILYDYHLAEGVSEHPANGFSKDVTQRAYQLAILKKYDVTEAQFDTSMVYYMRHTERLHAIYENLVKRMNKEVVALGGSVNDMYEGFLSANGDTTDVWTDDRSFVFSPTAPFNQTSFSIKVDTTFHKGDALSLNFDAQFIYQDGVRDGIAMLSVRFGNDSIAYQMQHIMSSSTQDLRVRDNKHLGIKEVKGFFILNRGTYMNTSTTTLQILFIQHIRLIKMHENKAAAIKAMRQDSIRRDSMLRQQRQRPITQPASQVQHTNTIPTNIRIDAPISRHPIRRLMRPIQTR